MADNEQVKKPVADEIATTAKDIDIFSGWLARYENPDPVLRSEAGGQGIRLYDEVARDWHAAGVLQTRYLAVTGKEWEILPADDSARAQEIATFVKGALLACNFDQARQEMLQGILYGFYPAEVMWGVRGGKVVVSKIRAKHPRRFSFGMDRGLRLLTPENMVDGEPVPDRKFLAFTYGSSDNPYGSGLGQKLWWPVWFKKNGVKFWLVFLEKFGMPTVVGKYPTGASKADQDTLLEACDAVHAETGVKIPDTMLIELLEAARTGDAGYEKMCDYMDRAISKVVLGQTLTTEVKGDGSYAAGKVHDGVRDDITKADADLLCECLNATLIRWLVDFNFSGVTEYPEMWIRTEEGDDLNALSERDERLTNQGVTFTPGYYQKTYNLEKDDFVMSAPRGSSGKQGGQPGTKDAAFSENMPEHPPELIADQMASAGGAVFDAWILKLEEMARQANSLEELKASILAAYGDLPEAELAGIIRDGMMAAEAAGRFDLEKTSG